MFGKRFTIIFSILTSLSSFTAIANAIPAPQPPSIGVDNYLLIDMHSQQILAAQNPNERVAPASITKMMTMYVIDHELKNGRLKYDDEIHISENAWKAPGSRMFLEVNSKVPVRELVNGIIIQSGNDASIALAEHIAGSETDFANLMNYYAKQLGMTNSNFKNATGLPHDEHYSCATDLGKLATAIISEFPQTYKLYSAKNYTYHGIRQFNRNRLLWRNQLVDGIKTGHTDTAGYCLVASAQKNNMRLIAVVMGAKSEDQRTSDSNSLINWGFRFFDTVKVFSENTEIQKARIWMGKNPDISLGAQHDIYVTLLQGEYSKLKTATALPENIVAPLKKGDNVGVLDLKLEGRLIKQCPLVALEDIHSASAINYYYDYMKLKFGGLLNNLTGMVASKPQTL